MRSDAAGDELPMIARHCSDAAAADIEGDRGDVSGGILRAGERHRRIAATVEQIVERHHAIGQVRAEGADMADGKEVRRHLHGHLGLRQRSGAGAGDDSLGADAGKCGDRILPVPKQRQRRRDHAGAQDSEQRQHALHRIRQLQRHHCVGRKAQGAQARGKARNEPVGLRIREHARRAVGECCTIGRIDQRQRVRVAHAGAAEQVVKGYACVGGNVSAGVEDHDFSPACHQVSGR